MKIARDFVGEEERVKSSARLTIPRAFSRGTKKNVVASYRAPNVTSARSLRARATTCAARESQLATDNDDSLQAVSGDATEFEPAAGSPNSKFNKHIPVRGNEWWWLRA